MERYRGCRVVQAPLTAKAPTAFVLALAMFHVAALVSGHVLGNKTSGIGPFIVTLTVLSFPVTFLTTDLLNEHGGSAVARRVTALSVACVGLAFAMIELARLLPAAADSHLPEDAFDHVLAVPPAQAVALLSAMPSARRRTSGPSIGCTSSPPDAISGCARWAARPQAN